MYSVLVVVADALDWAYLADLDSVHQTAYFGYHPSSELLVRLRFAAVENEYVVVLVAGWPCRAAVVAGSAAVAVGQHSDAVQIEHTESD